MSFNFSIFYLIIFLNKIRFLPVHCNLTTKNSVQHTIILTYPYRIITKSKYNLKSRKSELTTSTKNWFRLLFNQLNSRNEKTGASISLTKQTIKIKNTTAISYKLDNKNFTRILQTQFLNNKNSTSKFSFRISQMSSSTSIILDTSTKEYLNDTKIVALLEISSLNNLTSSLQNGTKIDGHFLPIGKLI